MTAYEKIAAEACPEGCGKGKIISTSGEFETQYAIGTRIHYWGCDRHFACGAPTKDKAIERLAAENKDLHRQRNESWEESHSLREALNRLAAASECLCTPGMEEGCCRCQAYSALNEERPRPFVEELRAENKRMREALEKISAEGFWSSMNSSAELVEILDEHKELADAALAPPPAGDARVRRTEAPAARNGVKLFLANIFNRLRSLS